jgi:hypothetical protein
MLGWHHQVEAKSKKIKVAFALLWTIDDMGGPQPPMTVSNI